jgi:hypothetical protein
MRVKVLPLEQMDASAMSVTVPLSWVVLLPPWNMRMAPRPLFSSVPLPAMKKLFARLTALGFVAGPGLIIPPGKM